METDPRTTPIDITGEFTPDPIVDFQALVDAGMGYFDEEGLFIPVPPRDLYE